MPRGEFGNTVAFARQMLNNHWDKEHKGDSGDQNRPYECEVCRNLWMRWSQTVEPGRAVPISYVELISEGA